MAKKAAYDNESIQSLKGADRVRKRPGVIFGSDGIEGCEHSVFEILSNSIDEAREGRGDQIVITRFADGSVEYRISARVFRLILIKMRAVITGNCVFASCMQAANIKPTKGKAMNIPWGSTDWAFAPPNMLRSIWMLKFSGMGTVIRFGLKREKMWEACTKSPRPRKKLEAGFVGSRI